jgi:hypothetical protein
MGKPIGEDETVFFRSRSDSMEFLEDERFALRMPEWSFDDMILNAETAQEIDSVCAKVEYHSVLYEQWGSPGSTLTETAWPSACTGRRGQARPCVPKP